MTRRPDQLRPVRIEPYPTAAAGSVVITCGQTRVLCTAALATDLPPFLQPKNGQPPTQGWITAEYAMLPGSTPQRKKRGPDSRATEIQRLIGRALRAAVDLTLIPGVCVTVDCDVLVADGGTRTASITGGYVALMQALRVAVRQGVLKKLPPAAGIAAVSVGIIDDRVTLDLDYVLDVQAQVDLNVVMDKEGRFIEIQGTAEHGRFTRAQLDAMLTLAARGIKSLRREQERTLRKA